MAELKYADIFSQHIIDMYAVELKSNGLFQSNSDIQIVNGKQLKLPKLTVSGYQDHNRTTAGFKNGSRYTHTVPYSSCISTFSTVPS